MISALKLCKKCGCTPDIQNAEYRMIRIACHKCMVATKTYEVFMPLPGAFEAAFEAVVAEWNEMNTEKGE